MFVTSVSLYPKNQNAGLPKLVFENKALPDQQLSLNILTLPAQNIKPNTKTPLTSRAGLKGNFKNHTEKKKQKTKKHRSCRVESLAPQLISLSFHPPLLGKRLGLELRS